MCILCDYLWLILIYLSSNYTLFSIYKDTSEKDMSKFKYDLHDVSLGLKKLRDFLIGRSHNIRGRFPPLVAPRSIPPPDIPRAPEYKYSNQYYHERHVLNSVKPPVVAPVAQGPPMTRDPTQKAGVGGIRPECVFFSCMPTPGPPWWWDGHCYYEYMPDPCQPKKPKHAPNLPCPQSTVNES